MRFEIGLWITLLILRANWVRIPDEVWVILIIVTGLHLLVIVTQSIKEL